MIEELAAVHELDGEAVHVVVRALGPRAVEGRDVRVVAALADAPQRRELARRAALRSRASSSCARILIFFRATASPVALTVALYTDPNVPSPSGVRSTPRGAAGPATDRRE